MKWQNVVELEMENFVRREVQEHQANLAWVNSGRAERGRQRSVVQRELERQRPGSVSQVGLAESPPSTRASTPSPSHAFVYDSERDNDVAVVDNRIVSCARPKINRPVEQSADQVEQPWLGRPSSEPENTHPVHLFMIQTRADNVIVASTPKVTVSYDNAVSSATTAVANPSLIPLGYVLVPITPSHPAPVGVGKV